MIDISIEDRELQAALARLTRAVQNPAPVLQAIGWDIMERAKERFATGIGPDGTPWAPNKPSTLERFLDRTGGNYKKDGSLSKKGQTRLSGKKPLIGATRDLSRQFHVSVDADSVTIGNSMIYAAIQQFGGKKAQFPHLWGDIPPRPFMPITPDGDLTPNERALVTDRIARYLDAAIG